MDKQELEKLSPDELKSLSEGDTSKLKYDRYYVYQLAFDKYNAEGKSSEAEDMRREVAVLQLSTHSSERRFSPLWTMASQNGEETGFPDLQRDFPDDAMDYYRKRADKTENPILKARYCDLIWEKERDHIYGREAVRSYLACWPLYVDNDWNRQLVDSLTRAMAISCMLKDQSPIDSCMDEHLVAIGKMMDKRMTESIGDIIDSIVSNVDKCSKPVDFDSLLKTCELAIKEIGKNQTDGFLFQRELLEVITRIFKILTDTTKITQTRVRIAESYIEEGDWKKANYPNGNLVAAMFYTNALKEYSDIGGFADRINEIKIKIAEANEVGMATELKPIVSEIDVPVEPFEKHVQIYESKTPEEMLYMISVDRLLPSYQRAVNSAMELSADNPLWRMMPFSILKGNIHIKSIAGEQELLEFHAIQNFQISYRTITVRLLGLLFKLLETKSSTFLNDLSRYFTESEIISGDRVEIIKSGLSSYNSGNFTAAFHVLIFQVEGVLRDIVGRLGLPTFSFRSAKNEMRERQLDDILKTLSQIEGFDKDLAKFLEIFLCRIEADNYRNEVAHGLLTSGAFTKENCQLLLLCLIKLASYSVKKNQPDGQA